MDDMLTDDGVAEVAVIISEIIQPEIAHLHPMDAVTALLAIVRRAMEGAPTAAQVALVLRADAVSGCRVGPEHDADPGVVRVRAESPSWRRAAEALGSVDLGVSP